MPITAVTGSASGIGAALCAQLRNEGHTVIGIDRANADVNADLSTADGCQQAIDEVLVQANGALDHLVLCAGVGVTAPSTELILAVNYFAVSRMLDGLLGAMSQRPDASAVVVGSVASVQPGINKHPVVEQMLSGDEAAAMATIKEANDPSLAYGGSKLAVSLLVRRKVREWAKHGVRLNVVAPGVVETPLYKASTEDARYGEATRNFVAPIGRGSQPDELANVIRFLLSTQASFMHGTVVFADGGMDAMMRPDRF